jgi:hypothetical protein
MQAHSHTKSCKKKNNCRFGFPRFPMRATAIVTPLEANDTDLTIAKKNAKKVKAFLEAQRNVTTTITFEALLTCLGLTDADHLKAIRTTVDRPRVLLK